MWASVIYSDSSYTWTVFSGIEGIEKGYNSCSHNGCETVANVRSVFKCQSNAASNFQIKISLEIVISKLKFHWKLLGYCSKYDEECSYNTWKQSGNTQFRKYWKF